MRVLMWIAGWLGCFVLLYGGYIVGSVTHPVFGVLAYVVILSTAETATWLIEKHRPQWLPRTLSPAEQAEALHFEEMRQAAKEHRRR